MTMADFRSHMKRSKVFDRGAGWMDYAIMALWLGNAGGLIMRDDYVGAVGWVVAAATWGMVVLWRQLAKEVADVAKELTRVTSGKKPRQT